MTAPVASLFITPLDPGGQTAAPSAGATAGSDSAFDALVSAFFEGAQAAQTGSAASADFVKATLTVPAPTEADETQPAAANTAAPQPANPPQAESLPSQTPLEHDAPAAAEHGLAIAALQTDFPFSATVTLQDLAQADGTAQSQPALPQQTPQPEASGENDGADAAPFSDAADLQQATTSLPQLLADQSDEKKSEPTHTPAIPVAAAKEDKRDGGDERTQDPVLDIVTLSELAPRVVAQFLAVQAEPDATRSIDKTQQSAPVSENDKTTASEDAPSLSAPAAPAGNALASADQSVSAQANAPSSPQTVGDNETQSAPPRPAAQSTSAPTAGDEASDVAAQLAASQTQNSGPGKHVTTPANDTVAGNAADRIRSAPGQVKTPFEPAQPVLAQTAQNEVPSLNAPDSAQASVTTADAKPHVTAPIGQADRNNAGDGSAPVIKSADALPDDADANKPPATPSVDAANLPIAASAGENAIAVAQPSVATARTLDATTAIAQTRDGNTPSRPAVSQAATADSNSPREKAAPVTPASFAQTFESPKALEKPASPHISEPADAATSDQNAGMTPSAETLPPQTARADAPDAPNQVQLPPVASDVFTGMAAHAHNFEVPLTQGAAPSTQDVPVKFAFSAPNVPDGSAFDALALKIASHSSDGDSRFSIRLDPPELGKIEVNLTVDAHGHAQAELSADKPQTLDILQKDASSLERALKDAGLNLTGGLAFSLKGDGRSQGWRDTQGGRSRSLQIAAADAVSANATLAARGALAAHAYGLTTSQLDIRV